jgi:hypothetical protein
MPSHQAGRREHTQMSFMMTACILHHERDGQPLLLAGSYHHVYSGQKHVAWQARSESVFLPLPL